MTHLGKLTCFELMRCTESADVVVPRQCAGQQMQCTQSSNPGNIDIRLTTRVGRMQLQTPSHDADTCQVWQLSTSHLLRRFVLNSTTKISNAQQTMTIMPMSALGPEATHPCICCTRVRDSCSITKQHRLWPNAAGLMKQDGRAQASVISRELGPLQACSFCYLRINKFSILHGISRHGSS